MSEPAVRIDLHMHSTASDGVLTPMQLLDLVRESRLTCFSVTDHDTVEGADAIAAVLNGDDPQFVTGVELSVNCDGADLHMLAYDFDATFPPFRAALTNFQQKRRERGYKIVERLRELGAPIEQSTVNRIAGNSVVGRPHLAEAMIEHKIVRTVDEAFRKYLGYDSPAYIPKVTWSPGDAIAAVHAAGGVAVVAHPGIADMQRFIPSLVPLGLDGIEVYHTQHSASQIASLQKLAREFDLLVTGGTDFHGRPGRNGSLGMAGVTNREIDALVARSGRYKVKVAQK